MYGAVLLRSLSVPFLSYIEFYACAALRQHALNVLYQLNESSVSGLRINQNKLNKISCAHCEKEKTNVLSLFIFLLG